jgi:hypothetical protein
MAGPGHLDSSHMQGNTILRVTFYSLKSLRISTHQIPDSTHHMPLGVSSLLVFNNCELFLWGKRQLSTFIPLLRIPPKKENNLGVTIGYQTVE